MKLRKLSPFVVALAALTCQAHAQSKADVVRAAFQCARHGQTFDAGAVTAPQTDHLPSLEGLSKDQYRRWIDAVRSDAKHARAVLANHYLWS